MLYALISLQKESSINLSKHVLPKKIFQFDCQLEQSLFPGNELYGGDHDFLEMFRNLIADVNKKKRYGASYEKILYFLREAMAAILNLACESALLN